MGSEIEVAITVWVDAGNRLPKYSQSLQASKRHCWVANLWKTVLKP
jgi:hypothetical protein